MKKLFPKKEFSQKKPQRKSITKVEKTTDDSSYLRKSHNPSTKKLLPTTSHLSPSTSTSWGEVAEWYDSHLGSTDDTYHTQVIFPNLLRMLGDIKGKKVLDLACGQGVFTDTLASLRADTVGIDISKELIAIAKERNTIKGKTKKEVRGAEYFITPSDDLYMIKDHTQDIVVCVLALQNIEKLDKTLEEVSRVLVKGGRFIVVLNHPMYRNPRKTHWGYDEDTSIQYRRVDEYMSESSVKIDMTPGSKVDKKYTISFHRPLQLYVKAFAKHHFAITRLEEWISHRESKAGPRQRAENISRKEIPLFMCIEVSKAGK